MNRYDDISLPDIEEGLPFLTEETATTKTGLIISRIKRRLKTKEFWIKSLKFVIKAVVVVICAIIFNWVFHNQLCDFLFKCGCTWNWAGSWDKCNVHNAEGPHCPWCMAKFPLTLTTDPLMEATIVISFLVTDYFLPKWRFLWLKILVAVFIGFLLVGFIVGLIFKLTSDYPYFIGK